jgi:hypothetical protein
MEIALRGSSPCATIAAILLMTRARQLGMRLRATLVGDPTDIAAIHGPAVVYSPVLASCGIGRDLGTGATVVVRGAPGQPLMVSLNSDGVDGWFLVDRDGRGCHPATQAFVRLAQDPRVPARKLGKDLRRAMEALGMVADPAVLDVLFGAPTPPLSRLSLALRAGRYISGERGEPVTRYLSGHIAEDRDPLPGLFERARTEELLRERGYAWILDGLATSVRDRAEEWLEAARAVAQDDNGRDLVLVHALAETASHLVQLPPHSILPPLPAHADGVAIGIKAGLTADGDEDANAQLKTMFTFLGGRYAMSADHVHDVAAEAPPGGAIERWRWFCTQAVKGRDKADELWPSVVDPPQ